MGVPRFFSWVNNNYNVIIDSIIKPNEFYFDLNCLLHPKCFEVAGEVLKENPNYDLDKNQHGPISVEFFYPKGYNHIIDYTQKDIIKTAIPLNKQIILTGKLKQEKTQKNLKEIYYLVI